MTQHPIDEKGLEAALDAPVVGACPVHEYLDFTASDAAEMGVAIEGENFAGLDIVRIQQWRDAGKAVLSAAIRAYLSATTPDQVGEIGRLTRERDEAWESREWHRVSLEAQSANLRAAEARLREAEEEIARCHARLEIDHVYVMGDTPDHDIVRQEVPMNERQNIPDAVECRDATIALLEADLKGSSNSREKGE
jgi:hypothetical protein